MSDKTSGGGRIERSDREWRERLSREAYDVTRRHGTERPWTSPLNGEKRQGMFTCTCCGAPLFSSEAKFDSGTGWPSYCEPAGPGAVSEHEDRKLFMRRTEVRCARCDAHLGHVFPDGPEPTGMRYCINGVALDFEPEAGPAGEKGDDA